METRLPRWRNIVENPQPLVFAVCISVLAVFIGVELWTSAGALLYRPAAASNRNHTDNAAQQLASDQINAAELFGRAANQNNLPETNVPVTLRAVFAASDPRLASAVIETSDGRTQVIKVGAAVSGDATLQEVRANSIVLARNGTLETLLFPAPEESSGMAVAQTTPAPNNENQPEPDPTNAPPAGASPDEIKRAAILQRLEELRARSSR